MMYGASWAICDVEHIDSSYTEEQIVVKQRNVMSLVIASYRLYRFSTRQHVHRRERTEVKKRSINARTFYRTRCILLHRKCNISISSALPYVLAVSHQAHATFPSYSMTRYVKLESYATKWNRSHTSLLTSFTYVMTLECIPQRFMLCLHIVKKFQHKCHA